MYRYVCMQMYIYILRSIYLVNIDFVNNNMIVLSLNGPEWHKRPYKDH